MGTLKLAPPFVLYLTFITHRLHNNITQSIIHDIFFYLQVYIGHVAFRGDAKLENGSELSLYPQ